VRAIADNVVMKAKQMGYRPRGVEGTRDSEWVLVDLQDVLVHVMLPRVREFYALEQLWEAPAEQRKAEKQPGARANGKPKTKTKTAAASERQRTARPAAKRPRTTRRSARR
jgi:sRNA-binding protein